MFEPFLLDPVRRGLQRQFPAAARELVEAAQHGKAECPQRIAVIAVPFLQHTRWRSRQWCGSAGTDASMDARQNRDQIGRSRAEFNGGVGGMALEELQILGGRRDGHALDSGRNQQEPAPARSISPLLPHLTRELRLVMRIIDDQQGSRSRQAPRRGERVHHHLGIDHSEIHVVGRIISLGRCGGDA